MRCITTNGFVKANLHCVMGRGCALEYAKMNPLAPLALGRLIIQHGNNVHVLQRNPYVVSFPVKHKWFEEADIELIKRSCGQLVDLVTEITAKGRDVATIVLPRPGCGNGRLKWADVKPVLASRLDDRFHVITF
jgi:hypothetical protein